MNTFNHQFDYTLPKVNALLRGSVELERFQESEAVTGGATGAATGLEEEEEEEEDMMDVPTGGTGGEDEEPLRSENGDAPWTMAEAIEKGMEHMCSSENAQCGSEQIVAMGMRMSPREAHEAHCDAYAHPELTDSRNGMRKRCACLNAMFEEPVDKSHDEFNCCFPGPDEHLSISYMVRACRKIAQVSEACANLIGSDWKALSRVGDGKCDLDEPGYNTESCNYDGGDCCMSTCEPFAFSCDVPFDCRDSSSGGEIPQVLPTGTAGSGCDRFATRENCDASPECEWIGEGCAIREVDSQDRLVSKDFEFGVCQEFQFEESNLVQTKDQICDAFASMLKFGDDKIVVEPTRIDRDTPSFSVRLVVRASSEEEASTIQDKIDNLSGSDLEIALAEAGSACDMNIVSQSDAEVSEYAEEEEIKVADETETMMDQEFPSGTGSEEDDDVDIELSGEPKLIVKARLVLNDLTETPSELSQVRKALGDALSTCLLVDRDSVVVTSGHDANHVSLGVLVLGARDGVSIVNQMCELDMVDFEKDVCDLLELEGLTSDAFESMEPICDDMYVPAIMPVHREEPEGPIDEEEDFDDFEATGSMTGVTGGTGGAQENDLFDELEIEEEKELGDLDLSDLSSDNEEKKRFDSGWDHEFPSGPSKRECKVCTASQMMRLGEFALTSSGVDARCPASLYEASNDPRTVKFDRWCECLVAIQSQMFPENSLPKTLKETKDWDCCLSSESSSTIATQLHMCRLADEVPSSCENVATPWNIGDGRCDVKYNTAECEYDGGDCCPTQCVSVLYECDRDRQQSCGPPVEKPEPEEEKVTIDDGPYGFSAQSDVLFVGIDPKNFEDPDSGTSVQVRKAIAHGVHVSEKQVSFARVVPGVSETEKDDTTLVKIQILQSNVEDAKKDIISLTTLFDNAQILTAALDKVGLVQGVSAQLISSPELVVLHTHESAMKAVSGLESPEMERKREATAELSCVSNLEDKLADMKSSEDLKSWCLDLFDQRGVTSVVGRDTLDHVCSMVSGSFDHPDMDAVMICKNFHVAVNMFIGGEPDSNSGQAFPTRPSVDRQVDLKNDRCKDHPERPGCNRDPCSPHQSKGCDDQEIERCVCESNPFCCEEQWDTECVVAVTKYECSDRCRDPKVMRYDESVLGHA